MKVARSRSFAKVQVCQILRIRIEVCGTHVYEVDSESVCNAKARGSLRFRIDSIRLRYVVELAGVASGSTLVFDGWTEYLLV